MKIVYIKLSNKPVNKVKSSTTSLLPPNVMFALLPWVIYEISKVCGPIGGMPQC